MALPSSGAISFSDIQTEFGGSNPIAMAEYYAGGAYVQSGASGTNGSVPTSGAITLTIFHGTSHQALSVAASDVSGNGSGNTSSGLVTSGTPNTTPAGGSGSYSSYSWARFGASAGIACSNASAQNPTWSKTISAPQQTTISADEQWDVTLTDSLGATATHRINVHLEYTNTSG